MQDWQSSEIKGVIVAAGYGSRFLPATKTIPKEMLPLIDTPAIDFIINEFLESGIKDILIISSRRKKSLEDHLDHEKELEEVFRNENKLDKLKKIAPTQANIFFTRQRTMLGTGHAIYQAKAFCKNSAFVVAYPDDIFFCKKKPISAQMIDLFRRTGKNVLAIKYLLDEDISRYAALALKEQDDFFSVQKIVEKPNPGSEPSKWTSFGRYLFTPEFFDIIEPQVRAHQSGELYHIDTINQLAKEDKVVGLAYEGQRFDTGEPFGYLQTMIEYGLNRPDIAPQLNDYLKSLAARLS